jgi:translation elongation factor EF-G
MANSFSLEAMEGLEEVFRQSMRVSPRTNQPIRNLTIVISDKNSSVSLKTYEMGIIVASSLIRESLENSSAKVHEPYYDLEISVPDTYVGSLIQELQRLNATIDNMTSDGKINTIYSSIHLSKATKCADVFRAVTDGNAFWSFTNVKFIPVN